MDRGRNEDRGNLLTQERVSPPETGGNSVTKLWFIPVLVPAALLVAACAGEAGPSARHLVSSFKQGDLPGASTPEDDEVSNCASVALIKAAFCRFGRSGWYKSAERHPPSIRVVLHDGSTVELDDEVVRCVATEAHLGVLDGRGKIAAPEEAVLAYAVAAAGLAGRFSEFAAEFGATAQRLANEGSIRDSAHPSTCEAAALLRTGIVFREVPRLLGLQQTVDFAQGWAVTRYLGGARTFLSGRTACVGASSGHAWFVSRRTSDKYGVPTSMFALPEWFGRTGGARLSNAYCFRYEAAAEPLDCLSD
jgi:hypothetical protein